MSLGRSHKTSSTSSAFAQLNPGPPDPPDSATAVNNTRARFRQPSELSNASTLVAETSSHLRADTSEEESYLNLFRQGKAAELDATSTSVSLNPALQPASREIRGGVRPLSLEEEQASFESGIEQESEEEMLSNASRKTQWIVLAVASGACAAFNGVFAKLTTTQLTTTWATSVSNLLGLGEGEKFVEVVIRAIFFASNLIFNGIMWTLFTKALARGTSTTQVSVLNTSANFMITAVLGFLIFSESLPPLWFLGAAMLVAGNVIIGRREEAETLPQHEDAPILAAENGLMHPESEELLGESIDLDEDVGKEPNAKLREEDVLQWDADEQGAERGGESLI